MEDLGRQEGRHKILSRRTDQQTSSLLLLSLHTPFPRSCRHAPGLRTLTTPLGHAPLPCLGSSCSVETPAWDVPVLLQELGLWAQGCLVNCGGPHCRILARQQVLTAHSCPQLHLPGVLTFFHQTRCLHSSRASQHQAGESLKPESLELLTVPLLEQVAFFPGVGRNLESHLREEMRPLGLPARKRRHHLCSGHHYGITIHVHTGHGLVGTRPSGSDSTVSGWKV